ncbi:hypothetical protein [Haloprofundus halobius]|uniref:hypothetical protein n=1 Tax=Haloprofundus halobius TaxID=2876194 RepID=UPI001CCE6C7F|nr:hypothetical protein [Haloprofundus halobius]
MTRWRDPVTVVLSCFFLTAVVSGPVVAGVDLTPTDRSSSTAESSFSGATGNLTAAETTIPRSGYAFEPGVSGSGIHKLDAPAANLSVDSISGPVLVTYTLRIPELSFATDTYRTVDESSSRDLSLTLDGSSIASDSLEDDSYQATVELSVREGDGTRVLEERTVTIVVA